MPNETQNILMFTTYAVDSILLVLNLNLALITAHGPHLMSSHFIAYRQVRAFAIGCVRYGAYQVSVLRFEVFKCVGCVQI